MTKLKSEQYAFIDLLKGFGIFLVVWGHTMVPRSVLIYSFHMPLFFVISGFLHKDKPLREFLIAKIHRLYLPYALFTVVSWLFYMAVLGLQGRGDLIGDHLPKIISLFTGTGRNGGNDPIWYLTCLMVVSLLFWLLDHGLKKPGRIFLAALLISGLGYYLSLRRIFLPFKVDVALTALLFYCLGYYVRRQAVLQWLAQLNRLWLGGLLLFCLALHFYLARLNIDLTGIPKVSMISNNLGNYFLFYLAAICAIVFLFVVGYRIGSIHCLNFLGHNSLIVLAAHKPLLFLFNFSLDSYVDVESELYGIVISLVVIVAILPLIKLWNEKRLFSFPKTLTHPR
jgi:acyltransferase